MENRQNCAFNWVYKCLFDKFMSMFALAAISGPHIMAVTGFKRSNEFV